MDKASMQEHKSVTLD